MRNIDATYWVIVIFFALAFVFRKYRHTIRRKLRLKHRERTAPISRRKFFWISVGYSLLQVGLIYLALMSLFVAELWAGEMVGWHFWAAVAIVTSVLSVLAVEMWRVAPQPPFELFMRHGIIIDALLADAHMTKAENGTWFYLDKNWYIAIRPGVACAIYAPLIDPTQPLESGYHLTALLQYTRAYDSLRYVARDGTRVETRIADAGDRLNDWLSIHGLKICVSSARRRKS